MTESAEEQKARIRAQHEEARANAMPRMGHTPLVPITGKAAEILDHLHPGEPYFVFRAKDILSLFALDEYARMVEKFSPQSDHLTAVVDELNEFRTWQQANPDKVKLPD